jgi:hypothetical protein
LGAPAIGGEDAVDDVLLIAMRWPALKVGSVGIHAKAREGVEHLLGVRCGVKDDAKVVGDGGQLPVAGRAWRHAGTEDVGDRLAEESSNPVDRR